MFAMSTLHSSVEHSRSLNGYSFPVEQAPTPPTGNSHQWVDSLRICPIYIVGTQPFGVTSVISARIIL